ncbi:MAG: hypothetical protein KDD70_08080 [Bdellovibrionales bacterium]|nr:hypothetical protein [Bdellovibrionales bacterium]
MVSPDKNSRRDDADTPIGNGGDIEKARADLPKEDLGALGMESILEVDVDQFLGTLVADYRSACQALLLEYQENIGPMRVLKPVVRSGTLPSGAEFSVHGFGCRFTQPDGTIVEWEKGIDGRTDMIEPHRLADFAESKGISQFASPDYNLRLLQKAVELGKAEAGNSGLQNNVFFLA